MDLFSIKNDNVVLINENILRYPTPLGDVEYNIKFNGNDLSDIKPRYTKSWNGERLLSHWDFDNCVIEFLRLNIKPPLPQGKKVDDCVFGLWRVKALIDRLVINFQCCLKSNMNLETDIEPDEGLLAQTWENSDAKLTIGTADEEYMNGWAKAGGSFPAHFKNKITPEMLAYLADGVRITLPMFFTNDCAQVHFIAAWQSTKYNPSSSWYAVDVSPARVLKYVGIS